MSTKFNLGVILLVTFMPFLALSQEMDRNNAALADKWMATSVPEALSSRHAGEEVIYSGNLVSEEVAASMLNADNTPATQKISSLIDSRVYSSLQRQMKAKYLIDVIKTGQFEARSYKGELAEEEASPGVYLELHLVRSPKPFAWGDAELYFDYALLDRTDYLMNPYWDFGSYGPLTATPLLNSGRVAYFVQSYLPQGEKNEVVFFNSVPFTAVKKIVVVTGLRAGLLKAIREQQLTCPQVGGCEALIVERAR